MMGPNTTQTSYHENWNVLTSPWLNTYDVNLPESIVSPLEALRNASKIKVITQSTPVDQFAAHRFLLTLLYWKADTAGSVSALSNSLKHGELPSTVVEELEKESDQFYLYDESRPFLQDTTVAKRGDTKSAGSLFAEMATGTNLAHFDHGDDTAVRLCLTCVTVGILRAVTWSQAGGAGITPSIHGAPPIMALATGESLAVTLGLNLIPLAPPAGAPCWSGHFVPSNNREPIPYLEAFTWNPRRILLPQPEISGFCWRCGDKGRPTIGRVVYQKNDDTKKRSDGQSFIWQDPAAFYRAENPYNPVKSIDRLDGKSTVSADDLQRLIKGDNLPSHQIGAVNPEHQPWTLFIPCTTGKDAKTFDHRQVALERLTPDNVRANIPSRDSNIQARRGCDGFSFPPRDLPPIGVRQLIRVANAHLSHKDWAILDNAAYKSLHQVPDAFDLFAGIYWPLRRRYADFPARHTVWLLLKLMAATPEDLRSKTARNGFCPVLMLPRRQLVSSGDRKKVSNYPVGLPRGHELESALRKAIRANQRNRTPDIFDWEGFAHRLGRLID